MSFLEKLTQNQETILLAEIGALLHDIGKARPKFINDFEKSKQPPKDDHNLISNFCDQEIIDFLKKHIIKICNKSVSLIDIIEKHHKKQKNDKKLKKKDVPDIIRLLYASWNGYDGIDSGTDKGHLEDKSIVGQNKDKTSIATVFGYESDLHDLLYFQTKMTKLINAIKIEIKKYKSILSLREKIIEILNKYYLFFLGETRRPSNDVTLWDHSYSVATMFKCAVATNLKDCSNSHFKALKFRWNILSINVNILSILSKGIKLGDLIRYKRIVKQNFKECKKLIEIKSPMGNEFYQDSTGIYFLIAELNRSQLIILKKCLKKKLDPELMVSINYRSSILPNPNKSKREQENEHKKELLELFRKIRIEATVELNYPTSYKRFMPDVFNQEWNNKEICPVCQLRPKTQNQDVCKECKNNREKTAKKWLESDKNLQTSTIWLDEISDQNNHVAAICGIFNLTPWLEGNYIKSFVVNKSNLNNLGENFLKGSSPARIRRCWETTYDFINKSIVSKILQVFSDQLDNSQETNLRYQRIEFSITPSPKIPKGSAVDIEINGEIISPVCKNTEQGLFITTHNLNLTPSWGENESDIQEFLNNRVVRVKSYDGSHWRTINYSIMNVQFNEDKFQKYYPYLEIFTFPDQFMILVPAYQALDILGKIVEEYEKQFGKVRDRLPLHLGIIGFHRKTPITLVMDASTNWFEKVKKKQEEKRNLEAKVCKKEIINENMISKECNLTLKCTDYSPEKFSWKVPLLMGDSDVKDFWYPYIRVKGKKPSNRDLCFEFDTQSYCCHIKEIKQNDDILFDPSYFSLEYLDRASKRWRMGENILSLNEFINIQPLWQDISNKLQHQEWSISQLYAYWQEIFKLNEKFKDSDDDSKIKEKYIKTCMKNILNLSEDQDLIFKRMFKSTKEGLLDLCLFWNLKIRKFKLS